MAAVHNDNLTVIGDQIFSSSNEGNMKAANLDMITDKRYLTYLKLFRNIHQCWNYQYDGVKSNALIPERMVHVIRGNIPRDVYNLIIELKKDTEGMIQTCFNNDMDQAEKWIAEEFDRRLHENPEFLTSKKVQRSVLATIPIITKTLRNDCWDDLERAARVLRNVALMEYIYDTLGEDKATFSCTNRHHIFGSLVDSRSKSLLNTTFGIHMSLHRAMETLGIEPLSDDEALMNIGNCGAEGVAMLQENIQTIHFSPEFRKSIGVSPDPRVTFVLYLNGGDLFREPVFDIVEKYGFSVELR